MRSRSQRVLIAALFAGSLVALAVCVNRPASAASSSAAASSPAAAAAQSASSPRQLRGAEASKFLRESRIGDSLDGASAGAYVQQGKLVASDGAGQDNLGYSVAVSGDTAIVGAPGDNQRLGSAYVYLRTGTTWAQQQRLTASDGAAGDQFGYSVAVNGNTAVVGRYNTITGANRGDGKVYVFTRTGATWAETQTFVSSDIAQGDVFGNSLAFEGDTLLVGATLKNNGSTFFQGAAYVFTRASAGAPFAQQQKLTAGDGGFADYFGYSLALSGDTAVIGAPGQAGGGAAGGRGWVYVFTRAGSNWTQQQKLMSSDGAGGDAFGYSVGVSGDTAVVGARADQIGSNGEIGSAYIFARSGAVWAEQQKLTAQEATPRNDFFGNGVAIKNDTVIVGSPAHEIVANIANHGAVYVFTRSGAAWTRQQKIIHSDPNPDALGQAVAFDGNSILAAAPSKDAARGAAYVFAFVQNGSVRLTADDGVAGDQLGMSVAVSGDTAVVGAPYDDAPGQNVNQNLGAAYVFVRAGATWSFQTKLTASDGAFGDEFGASVAVSGDTIVVGAPRDDTGQLVDQGSAYVFTRSGATWTQGAAKLLAGDGAAGDLLGTAVALEGDTAVVGAVNDNLDGDSFGEGSVYVFVRGGGSFAQQQKLPAPNLAGLPRFGGGVAISGETLVAGAQGDTLGNAGELARGAAYVFVRAGATWAQQARLDIGDVAFDMFGASVAVSGDTAVIGAPIHDHGAGAGAGSNQGAAYVFVRTGSAWAQQQKLTASDAAVGDEFGSGVAVSGNTVVVGARLDDFTNPARQNCGAAYVFNRTGAAWAEGAAKLSSFDAAADDQFGWSVALSGDTAVVGSPFDDVEGKLDQGSAHVFTVDTGGGQTPATVAFASATAGVAEGFSPPPGAVGGGAVEANSVTINVTRTGDTTGTVFVRYAPVAADGSVGCAANTGTALPRCDYTGATGTLRFDPGQTEKPVRVFVTDDSFSEGPETFALALSAPQGAVLGAQSSVAVTLGDNDATPNGPNPIDSHGFFVHTQYTDFLGRPPEGSGYQAWLGVLNNCPNPTSDPACDRVTVASSFFRSQEYEIKGFFVFRFYQVALGRRPAYVEFAADLSRLSGDTADQVNAARAAFPGEFAARDAFRARYDALSDAAYVDALIQTAGVDLGARRQQLKDQLAAGTLTRAGVLREVVESQEVIARHYNAGFVASLYFGFLGRDPEPGGYENWLAYLNANPTDFRTMVTGFVNSVEYRLRFGKAN